MSLAITKNVAAPSLENGMDFVKLGSSDLEVSKVCMGTMTFGEVRYTAACLLLVESVLSLSRRAPPTSPPSKTQSKRVSNN